MLVLLHPPGEQKHRAWPTRLFPIVHLSSEGLGREDTSNQAKASAPPSLRRPPVESRASALAHPERRAVWRGFIVHPDLKRHAPGRASQHEPRPERDRLPIGGASRPFTGATRDKRHDRMAIAGDSSTFSGRGPYPREATRRLRCATAMVTRCPALDERRELVAAELANRARIRVCGTYQHDGPMTTFGGR